MGVAENAGGLGEDGQRKAVPRGQHLVVGLGRDALGARLEEGAPPALDALGGGVGGGEGIGAAGEDVAPDELGVVRVVEIALVRDAEYLVEGFGVFAEKALDLGGSPEEEFALDSLAVGILGAVEAAVLVEHLALEVGQSLADNAFVGGVAEDLEGVQVDAGERGVVVEHLLEVGDQPLYIDAVAREAAADLVVHAAAGHAPEGAFEHRADSGLLGLVGAGGAPQQEL